MLLLANQPALASDMRGVRRDTSKHSDLVFTSTGSPQPVLDVPSPLVTLPHKSRSALHVDRVHNLDIINVSFSQQQQHVMDDDQEDECRL